MRLQVMVLNKDIIPLLSNKLNTLGSGEGYEDQGNCGVKARATMMFYRQIKDNVSTSDGIK